MYFMYERFIFDSVSFNMAGRDTNRIAQFKNFGKTGADLRRKRTEVRSALYC